MWGGLTAAGGWLHVRPGLSAMRAACVRCGVGDSEAYQHEPTVFCLFAKGRIVLAWLTANCTGVGHSFVNALLLLGGAAHTLG